MNILARQRHSDVTATEHSLATAAPAAFAGSGAWPARAAIVPVSGLL
jgi:hypothetical protein